MTLIWLLFIQVKTVWNPQANKAKTFLSQTGQMFFFVFLWLGKCSFFLRSCLIYFNKLQIAVTDFKLTSFQFYKIHKCHLLFVFWSSGSCTWQGSVPVCVWECESVLIWVFVCMCAFRLGVWSLCRYEICPGLCNSLGMSCYEYEDIC